MLPQKQPIRIAHISDVHVYRHVISPLQFFSKQWIGNANVLLNRRFKFHRDPRHDLVPLFQGCGVRHVVISGDLSCTSLASEFGAAKELVLGFERAGMRVHLVPGNHDNYTKRAFRKKLFYKTFGNQESDSSSPIAPCSLAHDQMTLRSLGPGWWWLGLDTTVPAKVLRSNGEFCCELQEQLESALAAMPEGEQIVMTNHFPLTTTHPSHDMKRLKALRKVLSKAPHVRLYLHGHVHRQGITDGRPKSLPLLVNSGSCGLKRGATCHIIDLLPDSCRIQIYRHTFPHNPVAMGNWEFQREAAYGW